MTVSGRPWLRRFHRAGAGAPQLVCFPHAGGSAACFRVLSAALTPAVDVPAVQYPGRQDRFAEPLLDDVHALADGAAAAITGPVALFGHSLGAFVAFEVARRLEARGARLLGLVVSGCRAPTVPRTTRIRTDDELLAEVRRLSGTDPRVLANAQLRSMVLPRLRSDYTAAATYRYRPGPDVSCPIVALLGDDDPKVTEAEARGWAEHTSGTFELTTYAGGHFYINDHRPAVARLLGERVARWAEGRS